MDLAAVALTFGAIFLVELPDKTFLATLVLATKYRPLLVWIGVGLAFTVQTVVAVALGHAASFLPRTAVQALALVMFLVGAVISGWTGVPVGKMLRDELRAVLDMQRHLSSRVIGQDHALEYISRRIQTSRAGIEDPHKPKGVFMLVGPSGVGKTETALALSDLPYGGARNLITINMSE